MNYKIENRIYEDKNINLYEIERYGGRLLLNVLMKKLYRKVGRFFGQHGYNEYTVSYNGVHVWGSRLLDGEGTTVGQDYLRVLLELGLKRCGNIYEFCSGPGFIGYSLLANGFCEKLTLADINPKAVEIARKTARTNGVDKLVNIYLSDCLEQIPSEERWDLVVSNPPHFLPHDETFVPQDPREISDLEGKDALVQARALKGFDPDWKIHEKFYLNVKPFMKKGGLVVMQENSHGSTEDIFIPMIEAGGGQYIKSVPGRDVCGKDNGMYYMVSSWD